jgi:carbonic anhydrase
MSITEEVLRASRQHAADFDLNTLATAPRLAVLACMDSRLTVEQILGLRIGEAHIIRNAGGIATDDALRPERSKK